VKADLGFYLTFDIRLRLMNIDTPELRSRNSGERAHAKEATAFTESQVLGKDIIIKTFKDVGIYGRYSALVILDDGDHARDLATKLAEAGFQKRDDYVDED
jgi:endonuclease YncB( thermonuclease family)